MPEQALQRNHFGDPSLGQELNVLPLTEGLVWRDKSLWNSAF